MFCTADTPLDVELATTVAASLFEIAARTRVTSSSSSSIEGATAATTPSALLIG
jgi:hypothetical protein